VEHEWSKFVEFLKASSVVIVASSMGLAASASLVSLVRRTLHISSKGITVTISNGEKEAAKFFIAFRDYIGNASPSEEPKSSSSSPESAK
jgi:hypothetical protein